MIADARNLGNQTSSSKPTKNTNIDQYDGLENLISYHLQLIKIKTNKKQPLAILDLDGTLFNNFPRQIKIYNEKIKFDYNYLSVYNLADIWQNLNYLPYSILSSIENLTDYTSDYIDAKATFLKWFLSDFYLDFDEPFVYGLKLIDFLIKANFEIIFLTGRSISSMLQGTVNQIEELIKRNISEITLIMKPLDSISDIAFKHDIIEILAHNHFLADRFTLFLDDNSQICSDIKTNFPTLVTVNCIPYIFSKKIFQGYTIKPWL